MTGDKGTESVLGRIWRAALLSLLCIALCLVAAGVFFLWALDADLKAKPERYLAQLDEIKARHAPALAHNPGDEAALRAWILDLSALQTNAHCDKFLAQGIRRKITAQLAECMAEGMRLFPGDLFYVAGHAEARVDMLFPGAPVSDRSEDIEAARQAYGMIEDVSPEHAPVSNWTWYLHKRAAEPRISHAEALALLEELDAVIERALSRPGEELAQNRRNFLELRGEAAILSACRDNDPLRREQKLARGIALFRNLQNSYDLITLARALDRAKETLADPAFAKTLLLTQIDVLREAIERSFSEKHGEYPRNSAQSNLCLALEEQISFAASPAERADLIREARQECAAAADTRRGDSSPMVHDALNRLEKLRD